jgi:hypothetical protein
MAGGRKTRLWLCYPDWYRDPLLDGLSVHRKLFTNGIMGSFQALNLIWRL